MTQYRIAKSIGRGGMGQVLLAVQQGIGGFQKLVVIKKLHTSHAEDEAAVAMFLDEARIVASLSHPNVVQILDIGRDADGPFIAMEYLAGETLTWLSRVLTPERRIPLPVLCRIFADAARGLHHAHTAVDPSGAPRGIVHRDVSPSNIIVCFNGVTKIVDFGVAKAADNGSRTVAGTVKGKLSYLAPEQIQSPDVDARADVFQLGIVLHEILAGKQLFVVRDLVSAIKAITRQEIVPPGASVKGIPAELDAIVMRALARNPDERFPSAEAMAEALETLASHHGGIATQSQVATWLRELVPERIAKRDTVEREVLLDTPPPASLTPPPLFTAPGHRAVSRVPPPLPKRRAPPPPPHAPPVLAPVREVVRPRPELPVPSKEPARAPRMSTWTMGLVAAVVSGALTAGMVLWLAGPVGAREETAPEPTELVLAPAAAAAEPVAPSGQETPEADRPAGETSPKSRAQPKRTRTASTGASDEGRIVPVLAPVPKPWLASPKFPDHGERGGGPGGSSRGSDRQLELKPW